MIMAKELTQDKPVEKEYVLKVIDRCDQCSSQAYVLVKLVTGELMFCGHHYAQHESKLAEKAFQIIDEREKLIENRSQGKDY